MSPRILVVDDDPEMAETLRDILELEGWETRVATDGLDALHAVVEHEYSVVVMDVRMPRLNGIAALSRIHTVCPGLPIILTSAYFLTECREHALRVGSLILLEKPMRPTAVSRLASRAAEAPMVLLDSDPEFVEGVVGAATDAGLPVRRVSSPREAALHLRDGEQGLALFESAVPHVDGRAVSYLLDHSETAVLLMLAWQAEVADRPEILTGSPVRTLLIKPFRPDQLVEQVRRVVES